MKLKDFLDCYGGRLQDKSFREDLIEMLHEEVEEARTIGLRMGRLQREGEIRSTILSALYKECTEPL